MVDIHVRTTQRRDTLASFRGSRERHWNVHPLHRCNVSIWHRHLECMGNALQSEVAYALGKSSQPLRGQEDRSIDEVQSIEPRPLTEREAGWGRDILQVNDEWRNADVSKTQVVAEGPCGKNGVNLCLSLRAAEPENPSAKSKRESEGELWINTDDRSVINIQLSQFEGATSGVVHPLRGYQEPEAEAPRNLD